MAIEAEYAMTPKFPPRTVMLTAPFAGLLPSGLASAAILARSVVTASVNEPDRPPRVKVALCDRNLSDREALHFTVVSDFHKVDSHAVNPRRPPAVES
jgi:hypothetical protein